MKKLALSLFTAAALVPAVALAQLAPVRVGGNVQAPARIQYVQPVYPEIAKAAGVSGIVIVEAVVGTDGSVTEAKVIRSIALLDQAALDAVGQWKYTPTSLNGVLVPVVMTVTVNFSLDNGGTGAPPNSGALQPIATFSPSSADPVYLNGREVVRIGGEVKAPERTHFVAAVYPDIAQSARVSGIVIIEAMIDETGHVAQAKVVRSIALLDQAAIDAVMQWEYTPTLVNGVAVPVLMTVTVNFSLQ